MVFVKLLFTLIITFVVYGFIPNGVVIALGGSFFVGYILEEVVERFNDNFYKISIYLFVVSILLTVICMLIPDQGSRIAVWIITSIGLFATAARLLKSFSNQIYHEELEPYDHKINHETGAYYIHRENVISWYKLKWLIFASPIILAEIAMAFLVYETPAFGFISCGMFALISLVLYLVMFLKGIRPEYGHSDIHSFKDLFIAIGEYFKNKGQQFVNFFIAIGRFFKRLFTGELFKRKPKKYKPKKYKRTRSRYRTSIWGKIGNFFLTIFSIIGEFFMKIFSAIGRFFAFIFSPIGRLFGKIRFGKKYSYRAYSSSTYGADQYKGMLFVLIVALVVGILNALDVFTYLANLTPNLLNGTEWFYFTQIIFSDGFKVVESISNSVGPLIILLGIPIFLIFIALIIVVAILELALSIIWGIICFLLFIILGIFAFGSMFIIAPGIFIFQIICAYKHCKEYGLTITPILLCILTLIFSGGGILVSYLRSL